MTLTAASVMKPMPMPLAMEKVSRMAIAVTTAGADHYAFIKPANLA